MSPNSQSDLIETMDDGLIEAIVPTIMRRSGTTMANAREDAKVILRTIKDARFAVIPTDRLNRLYGSLEEVREATGLLGGILGKIPR